MLFVSRTHSRDRNVVTKCVLLHVYMTLLQVNVLLCGITSCTQSTFNSRFLAVSQCISELGCVCCFSELFQLCTAAGFIFHWHNKICLKNTRSWNECVTMEDWTGSSFRGKCKNSSFWFWLKCFHLCESMKLFGEREKSCYKFCLVLFKKWYVFHKNGMVSILYIFVHLAGRYTR